MLASSYCRRRVEPYLMCTVFWARTELKCFQGKLLDTTPWLSFPQNTFTRSVSAMHGQKRMVDITDLLRAKSVSISR